MTKPHQRQCRGKCGVISSQLREVRDEIVNDEIVTTPVWKCICCGFEEKRVTRKSHKSKKIDALLTAKLEQYKMDTK